jgi:dolichol-phosphate mannosyltransferase
LKQKVRILLPCFNEEKNLANLLSRINELSIQQHNVDFELVIVNDGSTDNTLHVANNFQSNIPKNTIDIQPNKGLANAMRAGFQTALENLNDNDIIIALDADDSHHPNLMLQMIAQINEGNDIVIASRFQKESQIHGLNQLRKLTGRMASMIFRIFTPIKNVRDFTCGYRAYKASILRKANTIFAHKFIEQEGFACMAEILLKCAQIGAVAAEVPMTLHYDRKLSESKMNVRKTILQSLKLIAKHKGLGK